LVWIFQRLNSQNLKKIGAASSQLCYISMIALMCIAVQFIIGINFHETDTLVKPLSSLHGIKMSL